MFNRLVANQSGNVKKVYRNMSVDIEEKHIKSRRYPERMSLGQAVSGTRMEPSEHRPARMCYSFYQKKMPKRYVNKSPIKGSISNRFLMENGDGMLASKFREYNQLLVTKSFNLKSVETNKNKYYLPKAKAEFGNF